MKSMKVFFLLFFASLLFSEASAGSIKLLNDSAYQLRARIQSADGSYLGEMVLGSNETASWNGSSGEISYYGQSQTPYRVNWYCLGGEDSIFSVNESVNSGSTVTAMGGTGARSCPPKKGKGNSSGMDEGVKKSIPRNEGPPEGQLP